MLLTKGSTTFPNQQQLIITMPTRKESGPCMGHRGSSSTLKLDRHSVQLWKRMVRIT